MKTFKALLFFLVRCLITVLIMHTVFAMEDQDSQEEHEKIINQIVAKLLSADTTIPAYKPSTPRSSPSQGNTPPKSPIFPQRSLQEPKNSSSKKWNPGEEPPEVQEDTENPRSKKKIVIVSKSPQTPKNK